MNADLLVQFRKHTDLTPFGSARAISMQFGDSLNAVGAATGVTFAAEDLRNVSWSQSITGGAGSTTETATAFNRPTVCEITQNGATLFAFEVESVKSEHDGDPWRGTITLSGRGVGKALERCSIALAGLGSATKVYTASTRAAALLNLMTIAGAASVGVSADFTATHDSAGVAWTDSQTIVVRGGGSLLRTVEDWSVYGFDWHCRLSGAGIVLSLWKTAGSDRRDALISRVSHGLAENVVDEADFRSIQTSAVGETVDGMSTTLSVGDAISRFGRRDIYVSLGGVRGPDVPTVLADQLTGTGAPARQRIMAVDPEAWDATLALGDTVTVAVPSIFDATATTSARWVGWSIDRQAQRPATMQATFDGLLEPRRRAYIQSEELSQGIIPVTRLDGASLSSDDGSGPPHITIGPVDPESIVAEDPNATSPDDGTKWGIAAPDAAGSTAAPTDPYWLARWQASRLGGDYPATVPAGAESWFVAGPPSIQMDPNTGDVAIRGERLLLNGEVVTAGGGGGSSSPPWLPDWHLLASAYLAGSTVQDTFNSPASGTSTGNGSRISYSDFNGTSKMVAVQETKSGTVAANVKTTTKTNGAEVSTTYDDGITIRHEVGNVTGHPFGTHTAQFEIDATPWGGTYFYVRCTAEMPGYVPEQLVLMDAAKFKRYDAALAAELCGNVLRVWRDGGDKIGFFGATPAVQPTGVAVTAAGIHAALVTLGLITP